MLIFELIHSITILTDRIVVDSTLLNSILILIIYSIVDSTIYFVDSTKFCGKKFLTLIDSKHIYLIYFEFGFGSALNFFAHKRIFLQMKEIIVNRMKQKGVFSNT